MFSEFEQLQDYLTLSNDVDPAGQASLAREYNIN